MNFAIVAIAIILLVLLLYWIFSPWLVPSDKADASDPLLQKLEKLYFDRETILENLRDLELDQSMQKITEADYQNLKSKMMAEAANIYRSLERLEKEDPLFIELEKMLVARGHK